MANLGRKLFLLLLFGAVGYGFFRWFTKPPPGPPPPKPPVILEPSGGEYFFKRLELPVPAFRQSDAKWAKEPLANGQSGDTLGSAGCAVASTAMILSSYGLETDPSRLNRFLAKNGGFTEQGWLIWEKAAEMDASKVKFLYEGEPSYKLIDQNLKKGNPVIIRLRYENGVTHFVVICGKEGHDYLIRDPGRGATRGVYPLKEFGSKIEALRYYERIATVTTPAAGA